MRMDRSVACRWPVAFQPGAMGSPPELNRPRAGPARQAPGGIRIIGRLLSLPGGGPGKQPAAYSDGNWSNPIRIWISIPGSSSSER